MVAVTIAAENDAPALTLTAVEATVTVSMDGLTVTSPPAAPLAAGPGRRSGWGWYGGLVGGWRQSGTDYSSIRSRVKVQPVRVPGAVTNRTTTRVDGGIQISSSGSGFQR